VASAGRGVIFPTLGLHTTLILSQSSFVFKCLRTTSTLVSFSLMYVFDRGRFFVQGLLITDVDSFGGMQARNVIVFAHGRPVTLRNSLLRQEKTQNANKTRRKLKI
jgi:hypothetical protein